LDWTAIRDSCCFQDCNRFNGGLDGEKRSRVGLRSTWALEVGNNSVSITIPYRQFNCRCKFPSLLSHLVEKVIPELPLPLFVLYSVQVEDIYFLRVSPTFPSVSNATVFPHESFPIHNRSYYLPRDDYDVGGFKKSEG